MAFATLLGLLPRFTPVRSPEGNGMAEAFVNTFKRDYVHVHARPDTATVLAQLPGWFEDYNERHPHKGLRRNPPGNLSARQQPQGVQFSRGNSNPIRNHATARE